MWGYVAIAVLISISYSLAQDGIEEILTRMPKLEMHAHLHGSVRRSTLIELAALANMSTAMKTSLNQYDHGVADRPFELFPIVHSIVTSKQVVRRIVLEMIEDYQQQNCIYLEIRTTPRSLPDGTTMAEYLSLITELIAEHNVRAADRMLVKLIVSIDRSKKFAEAQEALELAKSYMYAHEQKVIVGVDFSGNPLGGRFDDFVSIFQSARASGLNITIHTAEMRALSEPVDHEDRDETEAILSFGPDRLGHLLYPMDRHFTQMLQLKEQGRAPAIEVCPTTAFFLLGLQSYADHPHLRKLLALHYPFSINTDDSGIFSTNITTEISHVMLAFDLNLPDIVRITGQSIQHAFVSSAERAILRERFSSEIDQLAQQYPQYELNVDLLTTAAPSVQMDMSHLYTM